MNIKFRILLGAVIFSSMSFSTFAEVADSGVRANSTIEQPQKKLQTLFLDKATRVKIDEQRQAYLKPTVETKTAKILPKEKGKSQKPKRIYIPPKVAVSAVIEKPDGSRLVRVNNKYNRSPSKHINMDFDNSTTDGVPVMVQGRMKVVPVGSTLLTRKNKLVKTYKLEEAVRKKAVPKTKQVAVKERLDQVQILTPK